MEPIGIPCLSSIQGRIIGTIFVEPRSEGVTDSLASLWRNDKRENYRWMDKRMEEKKIGV